MGLGRGGREGPESCLLLIVFRQEYSTGHVAYPLVSSGCVGRRLAEYIWSSLGPTFQVFIANITALKSYLGCFQELLGSDVSEDAGIAILWRPVNSEKVRVLNAKYWSSQKPLEAAINHQKKASDANGIGRSNKEVGKNRAQYHLEWPGPIIAATITKRPPPGVRRPAAIHSHGGVGAGDTGLPPSD